MEKCKFCEAELEEGVTLCPSCGKENAEAVTEPVAEENMDSTPVAEAVEETEAPAETQLADSTEEQAAQENAEEAPAAKAKATPGKIALAVVAIVVLVAIIVALLFGGMGGSKAADETTLPDDMMETVETEPTTPPTTPADTGESNETCKGSYSVSDEEAIAGAKNVVATMGDAQLTNAMLQLYYWNDVNSFLSSEGGYQAMMMQMLNLTQGLDTQISMADQSLTWQQYFLKTALQNWNVVQAMALEAEAEGYTLDENARQSLEAIPAQLQETVDYYELESVDQLLAMNMGAGVTLDDFITFQETFYKGSPFYADKAAAIEVSMEEVEAFFNEHEQEYLANGLTKEDKVVDVRHVLIMPEGATNETIRTETFSDEAWAASEKKAQQLLDAWLAGDKTEDSFALLANENTQDGNDANGDGEKDGGLYTGVTKGQMVAEFEDWCFDAARKPGDTGIVKTVFGYHIMYYVGGELTWPMYAEQDVRAMKENEMLLEIVAKYPMEVDYNAIGLATVNMQ